MGQMSIAQLHSELEAAKKQIEILERQKTDWMIEIKELQTRVATTEFEKKEIDEKMKRCMDIEQKFVRRVFQSLILDQKAEGVFGAEFQASKCHPRNEPH